MGWQQFTIDLIHSLADLLRAVLWPLVVLAVAWRFKTEIAENIGDLLKRLESLKAGPVEGRWGARARHAGDAVARSQSDGDDDSGEPTGPEAGTVEEPDGLHARPANNAPDSLTESSAEESEQNPEAEIPQSSLHVENQEKTIKAIASQAKILRELDLAGLLSHEQQRVGQYDFFIDRYKTHKLRELLDIEKITTMSPRAAVLAAYATLEDVLRTLLVSTRKLGAWTLVQENRDLISKSIVVSIEELTQLKNEVGHEARSISANDAREYLSSLGEVLLPLLKTKTAYDLRVLSAVASQVVSGTNMRVGGFRQADFVAATNGGHDLHVDVQHTTLSEKFSLTTQTIERSLRHADKILIVTNASLGEELLDQVKIVSAGRIKFSIWRGPEDDIRVLSSLRELDVRFKQL